MSKRNKIFALGVLFCFFILFIFRPYEKVDSEMVNQRLRALEEPFRAVNICCLGGLGVVPKNSTFKIVRGKGVGLGL